ncbi:MAG: YlmC/YmxH family sporulation protein [Clostridiales bacterium]|nr:YlmC/YmxH family sporulation protein [Clostridiales bacterium]
MELSYKELEKRDVINIADGRCLGRIIDMRFKFPQGVIVGIYVPARKNKGIFWFLDKSKLYIDVSKIIKIGGDVILVDIKCGDSCAENTSIGRPQKPQPCPPQHNQCPPSPCPPPCPPNFNKKGQETLDLSGLFDQNGNIDLGDY